MRILAVDPGEKRIGVAISDPTGVIANPLTVLHHTARDLDAASIAALAAEHEASRIIVGEAVGAGGEATPQSRRGRRLAAAIRQQTHLPVELWDESFSTQQAQSAYRLMTGGRGKHSRAAHSHLDELAATYILQTYLDAHPGGGSE